MEEASAFLDRGPKRTPLKRTGYLDGAFQI
jgi:hypothetical protein